MMLAIKKKINFGFYALYENISTGVEDNIIGANQLIRLNLFAAYTCVHQMPYF